MELATVTPRNLKGVELLSPRDTQVIAIKKINDLYIEQGTDEPTTYTYKELKEISTSKVVFIMECKS